MDVKNVPDKWRAILAFPLGVLSLGLGICTLVVLFAFQTFDLPLSAVAIGILIGGAALVYLSLEGWKSTEELTLESEGVRYSKDSLHSKASWNEPLAKYDGISICLTRRLRAVVYLKHADRAKCIPLADVTDQLVTGRFKDAERMLEDFSQLLGRPQIP